MGAVKHSQYFNYCSIERIDDALILKRDFTECRVVPILKSCPQFREITKTRHEFS